MELTTPHGSVTAERDALGYPRIVAPSRLAGIWALGWFHATDRLIQVRLSVAIAQGRALELLGESPFARGVDRTVRLYDFAADAEAVVARASPGMRELLTAYCAGFEAGTDRRGWPMILRLLGLKRAPYRPAELVLTYRLVSWFGLNSLHEWGERLVAEVVGKGARRGALSLLVGDAASAEEIDRAPRFDVPDEWSLLGPLGLQGSNAIVVSKAASASGSALLIGDPHMEIGRIPPVMYAMHIELPEGDYLQGLVIPGLAWPSYGRNPHVAWGYTYGHGDTIDMVVESAEALRNARRRTVEVKVRGKPSEQWIFLHTEHGVSLGKPDGGPAPSIRWAGLAETHGDLDGAFGALSARSLDELVAAQRKLKTISLNLCAADSQGRIAKMLCGRVDGADGSRGLVARPAGPGAELSEADRPLIVDPPDGFLVSANERWNARWIPLPEPGYRAERLGELMTNGKLTAEDLRRAVADTIDLGARRLLAVWEPHLPPDDGACALVRWSKAQTGVGADHFSALALWESLHFETSRELLVERLGEPFARRVLDDLAGLTLFQHHLDDALALARPALLSADQLAKLLAKAWPRAVLRAREHPLPLREKFKNVLLQGKLPGFLDFDSAPLELRGGGTVPFQARAVDLLGQRLVFGPSGRYQCDLGERGGHYCMSGGASERRFGPGYGKGLEAWANNEYLPLR